MPLHAPDLRCAHQAPCFIDKFHFIYSGLSMRGLPSTLFAPLFFFVRSNPQTRRNRRMPPLPRLESQTTEKGQHRIAILRVCLLVEQTESTLMRTRHGLPFKAFKPRLSRTPRFGSRVAHILPFLALLCCCDILTFTYRQRFPPCFPLYSR